MMNFLRKLFYLTILLLTFVFGGCGNFSGNYEEIESSTSTENTSTTSSTIKYLTVGGSGSVYSSADGISWNLMCQNKSTTDIDDTKPTAFYDPNEEAYVIYVRRDDVHYNRKIGRCVTDDLCDWEKRYHPNHCPIVFGVENGDIRIRESFNRRPRPNNPTGSSKKRRV